MIRTTTVAVKDILLKDFDCVNEPTIDGFIETASAIIDRVYQCALAKGITLTSAELELLERWLTAHLYVQSDATYSERQTLRASGKFNKTWDSYLKQAYALDPSGCLVAAMSGKGRTNVFWGGKRPSNQIDYVDRR